MDDPLGIYGNSKILDIKSMDATHFYMTILMKGNDKMDNVFKKAPGAFKDKHEKELIYKIEITPAKRYFCRSIIDATGRSKREGFLVSKETQEEINQWLVDNNRPPLF